MSLSNEQAAEILEAAEAATVNGAPIPPTMAEPVAKNAQTIDEQIQSKLDVLAAKRGAYIYPLFIGEGLNIDADTVDDVYDSLIEKCSSVKRIEVIINSGGGDLHAAYNLGLLFRRFGSEHLRFIIPRWAKSAATLLVCAGDVIYMCPVAEIGPVDPQITQMNPMERRLEEFSPLHIEATLELIRDEFQNGHAKLANGLLQRLQFPLTLGGFKKSLEIGKEYITRFLSTRMFHKEENPREKAGEIAKQLVECYQDHGFCIDPTEAIRLGLRVEELPSDEERMVWDVYKLNKQKEESERLVKEKQMQDAVKNLPPDVLKRMIPADSERTLRASLRHRSAYSHSSGEITERLAAAVLTQRGEMTMNEIRALPFVRTEADAQHIFTYLLEHLKTETGQRKIASDPVLRWERYIRLTGPKASKH